MFLSGVSIVMVLVLVAEIFEFEKKNLVSKISPQGKFPLLFLGRLPTESYQFCYHFSYHFSYQKFPEKMKNGQNSLESQNMLIISLLRCF